jgi:hypothetical protein
MDQTRARTKARGLVNAYYEGGTESEQKRGETERSGGQPLDCGRAKPPWIGMCNPRYSFGGPGVTKTIATTFGGAFLTPVAAKEFAEAFAEMIA